MKIALNCIACGSANLLSSPAILMPFIAERALGWGPVEITEDWGLDTVPTGHAVCRVNTRACDNCGTMFLDLRFGEDEMSNLYSDYRGSDYNALRVKYEPGYQAKTSAFNERASWLDETEDWIESKIGKPGTVLDWGGDLESIAAFCTMMLICTYMTFQMCGWNLEQMHTWHPKPSRNLI